MNLVQWRRFFMWCTLINAGWLLLWSILQLTAADLIFRILAVFYPLPRETWDLAFFGFLAGFKLLVIIFNLTPWLALLILEKRGGK
jgi:hypothetical protein